MAASAQSETLLNPSKSLKQLYESHEGSYDKFPTVVSQHFEQLFVDDAALNEIPTVPAALLAGETRPLARFRGMVQDTLAQLMYASTIEAHGSKNLGGWGLAETLEIDEGTAVPNVDYSTLRDMYPLWVVTPPGESSWISEKSASSATGEVTSTLPHKFPLGNREQMGIQVKIYDTATPAFKLTDVVTFVGILTFDSLSVPFVGETEEVPPSVPTLHVLFAHKSPKTLLPFIYPFTQLPGTQIAEDPQSAAELTDIQALRQELVDWIAEEALCGDKEAAEWVLMVAVSRVHSRSPEVLPPSLTISNFPPPPDKGGSIPFPTLHAVMDLLVPLTAHLTLPANLLTWSTASTSAITPPAEPPRPPVLHYAPHSENDDLHSGVLQLPSGTLLTILEARVQEGVLPTKATENLQTLRDVLRTQVLQYKFPFAAGNGFEFPTDLPCIVLCEGGKSGRSLFLPETDIRLPLLTDPTKTYDAFKEVQPPPAEKLAAFRLLICGAISGNVKVNATVGKYIQDDFVKERSAVPRTASSITPEDLILRMNLVRLLALTNHEVEVSEATWDRVRALDMARRGRQA